MATFVLGFKAYADSNPQVGDPLVDEHDLGPEFRVQETSEGVLLYRKAQNDVLFIPKERRPNMNPNVPFVGPQLRWIGSPNFQSGRGKCPPR